LSEPPGKPVAMTSCYNSENWLRRNGNRLTLELKAILKTVKMTLIRPLMTNFRMTIRADCEVSACSPLPSSWKALAYWLVGVESALGWKFPSRLQALEIKQTLLSTNFASLALEPQAPEPTFANRFWRPREAVLSQCLAEGGGNQMELPAWWYTWGGCEEQQFVAHWHWGGLWGSFPAAAKTIYFGDPPCFSPAQHWVPACAFPWSNGQTPLDKVMRSKTQ